MGGVGPKRPPPSPSSQNAMARALQGLDGVRLIKTVEQTPVAFAGMCPADSLMRVS